MSDAKRIALVTAWEEAQEALEEASYALYRYDQTVAKEVTGNE